MFNLPKRRESDPIRQETLELIRAFPGVKTGRLTLAQRRHLRNLEVAGLIRQDDGGWYPTETEAGG